MRLPRHEPYGSGLAMTALQMHSSIVMYNINILSLSDGSYIDPSHNIESLKICF
jgi:hypothetical protein